MCTDSNWVEFKFELKLNNFNEYSLQVMLDTYAFHPGHFEVVGNEFYIINHLRR